MSSSGAQLVDAVILAGGRGSRLAAVSGALPKPLTRIGERCLIDLVLLMLAKQGVSRFVIAAGYGYGQIATHFLEQRHVPRGCSVDVLDTGIDAGTADRLRRVVGQIQGGTFVAAYCDCISDVDLEDVESVHRLNNAAVTMAVVRPVLPYGVVQLAGPSVTGFAEKPVADDLWVNSGLFVVERDDIQNTTGLQGMFEDSTLQTLVEANKVAAYRHTGFWHAVNTPSEYETLDEAMRQGKLSWLLEVPE